MPEAGEESRLDWMTYTSTSQKASHVLRSLRIRFMPALACRRLIVCNICGSSEILPCESSTPMRGLLAGWFTETALGVFRTSRRYAC